MTETEHYKLKKPAGNEYVSPGPFNDNADILDAALHELAVSAGDIDCGVFDGEGPVAAHNAFPAAHPLLAVDGNAAAASAEGTLEEHMADPLAHQNISLDGNMN